MSGAAERRGAVRGAREAWSEGGLLLLTARALRRGAEALQNAADAVGNAADDEFLIVVQVGSRVEAVAALNAGGRVGVGCGNEDIGRRNADLFGDALFRGVADIAVDAHDIAGDQGELGLAVVED